jgi:hypothetical protein
MSTSRILYLAVLLGAGLLVQPCLADSPAGKPAKPKERSFTFVYAATVEGLDPAKKARIWVPVPSSSEEQDVVSDGIDVRGAAPAAARRPSSPATAIASGSSRRCPTRPARLP